MEEKPTALEVVAWTIAPLVAVACLPTDHWAVRGDFPPVVTIWLAGLAFIIK